MKRVVITSAVLSSLFVTGYQGRVIAQDQITVTLTNQTFTGFNFSQFVDYTQYKITGSLTSVSANVTLNASVAYTYADDICVYVDIEPLSTAGFLQVGGFSNLSAAQRYSWPNGASDAPGTTCIGSITLNTPLVFSGDKAVDGTIWIGNGYGASGTSGTWTGTVTLHGVKAEPLTASCTAPTVTTSVTQPSCYGGSTGAIDISPTGGSPDTYTYYWSNDATTEDITSLAAGTYTVTVTTTSGGCSATASATLTDPPQLTASGSGTDPTCAGKNDGSASVMASGGTGAYTYAWSNMSTGSSITGLVAGTYTCTVTDAKSCTATKSVILTDPPGLTNIITNTSGTTVLNCSNPIVSVTATGGTSYTWSGGATTSGTSNSFSTAGTYTVTVTTSGGCTATESITITQSPTSSVPGVPVVSTITQPTCNPPVNGMCGLSGLPAGSWVLHRSGTGGPVSYTGTGSTFTVPSLVPGSYRFSVENADGCMSGETGPFKVIIVQY